MKNKDVEVWRQVPLSIASNDFEASSWGRVRLKRKWRGIPPYGYVRGGNPRTGSVYKIGDYARYQLNTKAGCYLVSRLICAAFHGLPPADKPKCLHVDENGLNNRPENLKWGTQEENLNAPGFKAKQRSKMKNREMWVKHWRHEERV